MIEAGRTDIGLKELGEAAYNRSNHSWAQARDLGAEEVERSLLLQTTREIFSSDAVIAYSGNKIKTADTPLFTALFPTFLDAGLSGITVSEGFGGAGVDYKTFWEMTRVAAFYNPAMTLSLFAAHNGLAINHLSQASRHDLKFRLLTRLVDGGEIGAWAFTESSGSFTNGQMKTVVKFSEAGDLVISSGLKRWITNHTEASLFVINGEYLDQQNKRQKISFVIEKDTEGFAVGKNEVKRGVKESSTGELYFSDVTVPMENIIAKGEEAQAILWETLTKGRFTIANLSLGIAERAFVLTYERLKDNGLLQNRVIRERLFQVEEALERVANYIELQREDVFSREKRDGQRIIHASMAKYIASENAQAICQECRDLFGGDGFSKESPIGDLLDDIYVCTTGEGANGALKSYLEKNGKWQETSQHIFLPFTKRI